MIPPIAAVATAATLVSKIGDVLLAPLNIISDWGTEPLRRYEFERQQLAKDREVDREITKQTGVSKALSEQRMREKKQKNDLAIQRETEIVRIITEIEQLKKDKDLERMKSVSDAMMEYQKELTRINVETVEVIGLMRIELQKRVYDLIREKTQQFYEHKQLALSDAQNQLERIHCSDLPDAMKDILSNGVADILSTTIRDATQFIQQLNDDMLLINKDINLIASSGQNFIQRHLEHFKTINLPVEIIQDA